MGRLFRSDNASTEKRNLLVFIHPTIVGDNADVRRIAQQRYDQLYSLQLAMDKDGNFAKLPENVEDIYQQRLPITSSIGAQPKVENYQSVPSGGVMPTAAVTTPMAKKS